MHNVYIYESDANDFSSIGLAGALLPLSCEHAEEAGGTSAITLVHPIDEMGKWKALTRGCILKAMTRVRTTPEIANGQAVTSVEIWTVKATAAKAQRYLYSKKSGGAKKKLLSPGTEVVVVLKPLEGDRYKVKTGKATGWIASAALDYQTSETITDIEDVAAPWVVRPQLFRIASVEKDTKAGTVTVYAPHITYDLINNITRFQSKEAVTAQAALDAIFTCDHPHVFEHFTDLANTRTGADWLNVNPMEALLDKETGFCKRFGAELIRDDHEMFFLARAGRNRGVRIEYGRNLLGVTYEVSDENVVTAILPTGVKKDGSLLYLTDDENSPDNYVLSTHVSDYPVKRCSVLTCEDCIVNGKQLTKELVRARMREQAQALFDDECDLPEVNLKVQFLLLGDTEEYAQYHDLDRVCLYDEVPVIDKVHGIEVTATVQRLVIDCLTGRITDAELGSVRECAASLSAWQIPTLDGGKLKPGSVGPEALEDESIPPEKLDPDLQEALNQAFADIEAAQTLLTDTRTWLDTVEATTETMQRAVTDNAGNITALRQTATEIRAGLTDAENNLAAVQLTAGQLQTSMTNAQGEISTIRQTANEVSSTVSDMQTSISSIRQTANGAYSSVATLDGQVQSLVTQLAEGVAIKLKNTTGGQTFETVVGNTYSSMAGATLYGLAMKLGGVDYGGIFTYLFSGQKHVFYGASDVYHWISGTEIELTASDGSSFCNMILGYDPVKDAGCAAFAAHIIPGSGNTYDLGGDGNGMRWRKVFSNNALNTSDLRFKKDVADLDAAWLLSKLRPIRYRLTDEEEPNGKLRFGVSANGPGGVIEAVKGTDIERCNLLDDDNPDHLYLNYTNLIAVLIEGWQRHEKEIEALRARIERLEVAHEHSD